MEKVRILIEVEGGVITRIISTEPIEVITVDWDNIQAGDGFVESEQDHIAKKGEFYQYFTDASIPVEMEIRDELKRSKI
jgi:hypothetical protein